jgi:hypothetical protein
MTLLITDTDKILGPLRLSPNPESLTDDEKRLVNFVSYSNRFFGITIDNSIATNLFKWFKIMRNIANKTYSVKPFAQKDKSGQYYIEQYWMNRFNNRINYVTKMGELFAKCNKFAIDTIRILTRFVPKKNSKDGKMDENQQHFCNEPNRETEFCYLFELGNGQAMTTDFIKHFKFILEVILTYKLMEVNIPETCMIGYTDENIKKCANYYGSQYDKSYYPSEDVLKTMTTHWCTKDWIKSATINKYKLLSDTIKIDNVDTIAKSIYYDDNLALQDDKDMFKTLIFDFVYNITENLSLGTINTDNENRSVTNIQEDGKKYIYSTDSRSEKCIYDEDTGDMPDKTKADLSITERDTNLRDYYYKINKERYEQYLLRGTISKMVPDSLTGGKQHSRKTRSRKTRSRKTRSRKIRSRKTVTTKGRKSHRTKRHRRS